MSVFNEALAAIEAEKKAALEAEKLYKIAREKWREIKTAYGPVMDDEIVGKFANLVKKYGPMAAKLVGAGGIGTAFGALAENEGLISGLFSKITSVF